MPEPQLQLLRSDNTSTCPGGRVGCRERYALRPAKTRSREVKRERAIARVRCSAESARAPFYKEAPTVPAPRRAHECPMSSAGAVRCCCAFLRARLAPLTTAHRQGLEKLGKGSKPRSRLAHHPRPSPMSRIACSNGRSTAYSNRPRERPQSRSWVRPSTRGNFTMIYHAIAADDTQRTPMRRSSETAGADAGGGKLCSPAREPTSLSSPAWHIPQTI